MWCFAIAGERVNDHDGLAFLLSLTAEARVVLRCSPFLTEQLATATKAKP